MFRFYAVLLIAAVAPAAFGQIEFRDSAPDRLVVSGHSYELALSKTNGAILDIREKPGAKPLSLGSRNGCLWAATFQSAKLPFHGGCNYPAGRDGFHYGWDRARSTLTLTYSGDATVLIEFHPAWFDLKLSVTNHFGATMSGVLFPADLVFEAGSVEAAYFPYYLPGVRIKPAFFASHRSLVSVYPGTRAFADYVALDIGGGRLAIYTVNPVGRIQPVQLGFRGDAKNRPGTFCVPHTFQVWTAAGANYETPIVRVRIGETAEQTILAYRMENGIDRYPSLAAKLGTLFPRVAAAPLVKMDFKAMRRTFREAAAYLDRIPAPAILHPVAYWPRNFDQNYPDFLPPDPRLGTQEDFLAFVREAQRRGLFVMPYTNPTWWDAESPAARSVPDVAALALQTEDGKPKFESYGPNRGFVASLHSPEVRARLARLMQQWREEVPVDFVLNDQIGSRSWLRDFNPAGSGDVQSYEDDWLEFTRRHAGQWLMTEDGCDRLAATETGFTGSLLTRARAWDPAQIRWGEDSNGNRAFGAGAWEPYPLGVWLFHDKVLFYHHDLATATMNAGIEVLTWDAAFGFSAGYLWPELRTSHPEWTAIAQAFQPAVLSRLTGKVLSEYREIAPDVYESRFGDVAVTANWNADKPYAAGRYTIAPSGCLVRSEDGNLVAGAFTGEFDGAPLSGGIHYLIATRANGRLQIRFDSAR